MLSPPPKTSCNTWQPWELADFKDTKGAGAGPRNPTFAAAQTADGSDRNTTALVDASRRAGYEVGFESGRADGLKAGRAAAAEETRLTAALMAQAMARLDGAASDLEQAVADELLALAVEIARKVVNQAIVVQPEAILVTIREALAQMPPQHAMIHLNTEDAALLRSHAGEQLTRVGHRIQEDPQLRRGDVVMDAGGAHLDSRLATRWQRVIATLDQDAPWLVADETETS